MLMLRGLGDGSSVVADANANADAIDPSWLRFLSTDDDDMMVGAREGHVRGLNLTNVDGRGQKRY